MNRQILGWWPNKLNFQPKSSKVALAFLKKWTILIYLNGQNELAPEMNQAKCKIEAMTPYENLNIIIEIGRGHDSLVKILRPSYQKNDSGASWHGVRRYQITGIKSKLILKRKSRNMADPKNLNSFISWGLATYPAEHYALIISGHGAPLLGVLPDFSQDRPYIMGIPEMCDSIYRAERDTDRRIDLLVLDACYFNYLETLYEFCKHQETTVQYLLTYYQDGPLSGMDYVAIINQLRKHNNTETVGNIVKKLPDLISPKVLLATIEKEKLEPIKASAHNLAFMIRLCEGLENSLTEAERGLLRVIIHKQKNMLREQISLLTIYYPSQSSGDEDRLLMADPKTINQANLEFYLNYAFCQNNHWVAMFTQGKNRELFYRKIEAKPHPMTRLMMLKYIQAQNPTLTNDAHEAILNWIARRQKWRDLN